MADEVTTTPAATVEPAAATPPTEVKTTEVKTASDGGKTLTQADVDRIVADRVARERTKFADYTDVKAKAQRLDEIEAANASELEKAVKKAREEGAAEVQATANGRLVAAEARALAAEARFRNPTLAIRAIDLGGVKVADDGTVDSAAVKALLEALAKDEPYLIDDGKVRPKPDEAQGQPPVVASSANTAPGLPRLREAYATTQKT